MTTINIDDYRTPEGGFKKDAPFWTIAYRKPRANRFLRIDLALSWDAARDLAGVLAVARPDLQVFYTTTAAAEVTNYGTADDVANILVDTGRRVRVLEGGTLTEFGTTLAVETAARLRADESPADPAAVREAEARDAYAHAGYGVAVTPAELAAGYADWDAGNVSDYERGQAVGQATRRRAVLNRIAELGGGGNLPPAVVGAYARAYAAGDFARALTFLRDDVIRDLSALKVATEAEADGLCLRVDGAHVGHMRAVDDECRAEVHQDPHDAASEALGRTPRHSMAFAAVDAVAARVPVPHGVHCPAAYGSGVCTQTVDCPVDFELTEVGRDAAVN